MESQRCRKEGWKYQMGFLSPMLINQKNLNDNYKETSQNTYNSLSAQYYKSECSILQIVYNVTMRHWVSLGQLVPLLHSSINAKSNACIYVCISISTVFIGFCSYIAWRKANL